MTAPLNSGWWNTSSRRCDELRCNPRWETTLVLSLQLLTASMVLAACGIESSPTLTRQPAGVVEHLGDYVQHKETGGHVYGYFLRLWKDGTEVVGLWSMASGEPADFPTVRVRDLKWDATGGTVDFTIEWCGTSGLFKGVKTKAGISGQLTDSRTGTLTTVHLRGPGDQWPSLSRADWLSQTEGILKRRRPRC